MFIVLSGFDSKCKWVCMLFVCFSYDFTFVCVEVFFTESYKTQHMRISNIYVEGIKEKSKVLLLREYIIFGLRYMFYFKRICNEGQLYSKTLMVEMVNSKKRENLFLWSSTLKIIKTK